VILPERETFKNLNMALFTCYFVQLSKPATARIRHRLVATSPGGPWIHFRFPKSANQFVAARLVQEIYKRSGLSAKVESMPPKRATIEAKEGRIDGEVSRIENYFPDNPELIRVTPAYSSITITAFSRKSIVIQSKEDLAKYKNGIVCGVQTSQLMST
jgi:hypothetical protein